MHLEILGLQRFRKSVVKCKQAKDIKLELRIQYCKKTVNGQKKNKLHLSICSLKNVNGDDFVISIYLPGCIPYHLLSWLLVTELSQILIFYKYIQPI